MDVALHKALREYGDVKVNAVLSKFTSYKIGGPASLLVEVSSTQKLVEILNFLSGEGIEYFVLGGGTNVLFPDDGFEGVVIRVRTGLLEEAGGTIMAESGVVFGALNNFALQHGLSGLEWSAGLPGTVGGAVRGNAGAAGGDVANSLCKVEAWIDREVVQLKPDECSFSYRESLFKQNGGVVLKAWFDVVPGDTGKMLLKMQEIIAGRAGRYPNFPSAGSFFKNVPVKEWKGKQNELPVEFVRSGKIPVGWLNEQAGLKGLRVGGAMVSEQHGNFLINRESATEADILHLVEEIKTRVYNKFGISLEEEVCIVR
jgi:UDP-N-acetylmuramate dehydrogenase